MLTAILVLAVLIPTLDDGFGAFDEKRLYGSIKSVAEDGDSIQLKTRKGTMLVSGLLKADRFVYSSIQLADVKDGTKVWILGKKQDGSDLPLNGYPPHITAVTSMVVGAFKPPKRTSKQRQLGIDWHEGPLKRTDGKLMLDRIELQIGTNRKILTLKKEKSLKLKKGLKVLAIGLSAKIPAPKEGEKPLRVKGNIKIQRLEVTGKVVPNKELPSLLGL